ncbi:MAG: hypothetical protein AAFQ82_02455 [Myxococcota bacterium]
MRATTMTEPTAPGAHDPDTRPLPTYSLARQEPYKGVIGDTRPDQISVPAKRLCNQDSYFGGDSLPRRKDLLAVLLSTGTEDMVCPQAVLEALRNAGDLSEFKRSIGELPAGKSGEAWISRKILEIVASRSPDVATIPKLLKSAAWRTMSPAYAPKAMPIIAGVLAISIGGTFTEYSDTWLAIGMLGPGFGLFVSAMASGLDGSGPTADQIFWATAIHLKRSVESEVVS